MFSKILAAVDLDAPSHEAVKYAAMFARRFGSEVVLMYADEVSSMFGGYDPQYVGFHIPSSTQTADEEGALRAIAATDLSGLAVPKVVAVPGPAVASITRVADEVQADLIVVGSHHISGWRRAFGGSVSAAVVRNAKQPVLVLPAGTYPSRIRQVICPVNFTAASRAALDAAAEIASSFDAELVIVHVHEAGALDEEIVHDRFLSHLREDVRNRCRIREMVLSGSAADRVLDSIELTGAELLVIGTQRVQLHAETVIGTTSERLLRDSPVPVLAVVHAKAPAEVERKELVTAF